MLEKVNSKKTSKVVESATGKPRKRRVNAKSKESLADVLLNNPPPPNPLIRSPISNHQTDTEVEVEVEEPPTKQFILSPESLPVFLHQKPPVDDMLKSVMKLVGKGEYYCTLILPFVKLIAMNELEFSHYGVETKYLPVEEEKIQGDDLPMLVAALISSKVMFCIVILKGTLQQRKSRLY